jgi:hypothetical protein
VLQRIDNIVGDPAGHRVHPLPLIEGTLVARGGAFYVDRTLKAKDRSPADAIPEEGELAIKRDDTDVVAFFRKTWWKPRPHSTGCRLVVQALNLERHRSRDCQ